MKKDSGKHHRRSIRLKGYDYSRLGMYFVTICVQGNACRLGEIVDGEVRLSSEGRIAKDAWVWLHETFVHVVVDCFVIMPNHTHAIIELLDHSIEDDGRGDLQIAPTKTKSLGRLVGAYKTRSTAQINRLLGITGVSFWQRNYYEHIIRNERALDAIRAYILSNPLNWEHDLENPDKPRPYRR